MPRLLHPELRPFEPSAADPFDRLKASHLLHRAGFGGTPEEVERVVRLGPQDAVDWLLDFPDVGAEEQSRVDVPDLSSIEGLPANFRELGKTLRSLQTEAERMAFRMRLNAANREAILATGSWWLSRMAGGPHPLQEKLTLFWHGHFTTSARDERSAALMWQQNELLRRHAAGNFREFVRAISQDPAMLDYLNNAQNRKAHPNENYARELMELFTLGIGRYTENDVKETARAFTGWAHDGDQFVFRAYDHDDGQKTILGVTGNHGGNEAIDIILRHPAAAPYIARRLWNFFVGEAAEEPLVQSAGNLLREAKWELRPLLRTMLASRAFYAPQVIGAQVKSPIQLMVGTIRLLDLDDPPIGGLYSALSQMGQVPLDPPNVKGWPGGRAWINTSTLLARYNATAWLAGGAAPLKTGRRWVDASVRAASANRAAFDAAADGSPQQIVEHWLDRLIQRPVDAAKKPPLISAVGAKSTEESVRTMVQLMLAMPEYQLC